MRTALRPNPGMRRVSQGASTPAPVGGWNARDALTDMPFEDAVILDNLFPDTTSVKLRRGCVSWASGLSGAVETLMPYAPPGFGAKLFAVNGGSVYDATANAAVGAPDISGLTNSRLQHVMFGNSAGNFLYWVNGADAPQHYNGTVWATPAITGVTAANLVDINVHKRRLFFVEQDSLSAWYLPVETLAGAAAELRLDGLCKLGGYLMAMGTWTRDSGDGIDDLAVFVTSEGEVVIYQGTDPSDANAWALVGVFRIGQPVGRRCLTKVGSELIVITRDGFVPISRAIASARSTKTAAISDKIAPAVTAAVREHGNKFGWEPILYPRGNYVLFNVPIVEGSRSHQYVMNTTTGSWCRFVDQEGFSWAVFGDELYFGGTAAVFKADTGNSDNGANILAEAQTAFTYLNSRGRQKRFTLLRPVIRTTGVINFAIATNVDFANIPPVSTPTYVPEVGSIWDVALWDEALWGAAPAIQKEWQSVDGIGHAVALRLKSASQGLEFEWFANDWVYEAGGFL